MKPKTMILLALAITCGLGASYMTSRLLAERQQPDAPETVEILVATKNISVHTKLAKPEEMFEVKVVAKANEPPDAIRDYEFLRNKIVRQGRNKGDHITAANLYDKFGGLEVPEGHKAIPMRVNLETTASGLASLPGKRVDLHLTVRAQNIADIKTLVLLQNVLVLAADGDINPDGKTVAPAQIVTFALNESDALTVQVAKEMGAVCLVMRNPDDRTPTKDWVRHGRDILERNKKEVDLEAPAKPAVVQDTKPAVTPTVPEKEPEKPKFTKHYYEIVNGSGSGQRTVERVYYYRSTEDGRILDAREAEAVLAAQTPPANGNTDAKKEDSIPQD